jgi:hypothetical protein
MVGASREKNFSGLRHDSFAGDLYPMPARVRKPLREILEEGLIHMLNDDYGTFERRAYGFQ